MCNVFQAQKLLMLKYCSTLEIVFIHFREDFSFIYGPILMRKKWMNANIMKKHFQSGMESLKYIVKKSNQGIKTALEKVDFK